MPRTLGWCNLYDLHGSAKINKKWQMNYETAQMQNKKEKTNRRKKL